MSLQGCWHLRKVTDLENLFQWKKANKTTTFKKAQKIWGTAGCSALAQPPGMLQNQPYMGGVPGTRNKYQMMRSNQSVPIHQGYVLLDADCQGQWLCGRADTVGAIHLDTSKAFTSLTHSSHVA